MTTNLNELARRVAHDEGMKVEVSIAQIKEIMAILFRHLAAMESVKVEEILKRYRPIK
jgi:hypothetical protein